MSLFSEFSSRPSKTLTRVFVDESFNEFERSRVPRQMQFALTEYSSDITAACAYPPLELEDVLGAHLSDSGKKQLQLQKPKNMLTLPFFQWGREEPFKNEHRILVPSPDVATYDLKPRCLLESYQQVSRQ